MKIHHLPEDVRGLIFDIDSTLYRNPDYHRAQSVVQIRKVAEELGRPFEEVAAEIERYREQETGARGYTPALAEVFRDRYGRSIESTVTLREELLVPERYLKPDARLADILRMLASRYRVIAVTNNPVRIGLRTLEALGVREHFLDVLGLDTTMESKPSLVPFRKAAGLLGLPFDRIVNIGDRYEIDLKLPLGEGMGAIQVESMDDIYRLPEVLPSPMGSAPHSPHSA